MFYVAEALLLRGSVSVCDVRDLGSNPCVAIVTQEI